MAALCGVAGLLAIRGRAGPFPWYVLFGSLTSLAMYPRADTLHAVVSSPQGLIGAAGTLALVWYRLGEWPAWRRIGVMCALLVVPLAAVVPQVAWRTALIVSPEGAEHRLDYQDLDLARAPVLVPRLMGEDIRGVVSYIQAGTPPGAPFFVYPVAPLFNFLADRPNPTRFDHLLPGTLSASDFVAVIDDLQRTRPRYVLWDQSGVLAWDTDSANAPLSDYIWRCYHQVATFRVYLALERTADTC
jgi:hypothetical protein